jgi:hypothetical protein
MKPIKPMIWHPEAKDQQIREHFDATNHAPYPTIVTIAVAGFCLLTLVFLLGTF